MVSQLSQSGATVEYSLPLDDQLIPLNPFLGQRIRLTHTGDIHCSACGRKTKKSYSQGYCFPCMQKLPQCDLCIMKPETCHHSQVIPGKECRDEEWGERNCMIDHFVYLSNTSAIKVGITRHSQLPTRWVDQGANQGLPILRVRTRHHSGLIETALAQLISDKTNWRTMLKGDAPSLDLNTEAESLLTQIQPELDEFQQQYGLQALEFLSQPITEIRYPVLEYPTKIVSLNLDKTPTIEGTLMGIKGQYLILDTGVINLRKYTSYNLEFAA
ncbi:DUF2797 domain-containing protein [Paraferrimonas sedimenticola]|uniref:DUF2797 domain-containing protein n=1 Tax=Paraferrimonas sedimenticola TaxID=375674 RepID=A0AA37RZE4_9GAMM|nr:hypothetical protein GCM10007895_34270 [Paraferrimonas sedimenticola]